MSLATTIVLWGLGLGVILGFIGSKTNFCTMGAVSDVVNMGSWGRMRAWILAIAVAIIGTNLIVLLWLSGPVQNDLHRRQAFQF